MGRFPWSIVLVVIFVGDVLLASMAGLVDPLTGLLILIATPVVWLLWAVVTVIRTHRRGHASRATPDGDPEVPLPGPRRTPKRRRAAIIGLVIALFVGGMAYDRTTVMGQAHPADFSMIRDAWSLLHGEYADPDSLDPNAMARAAISAMADSIGDTGHTYMLTPEEAVAQHEELSGSYDGIGVELDEQDDVPTVTGLVAGGPAAASALRIGDRIVAVDGTSTSGPDQSGVLDTIRGERGTVVVLTIERDGRASPLEVPITRGEVDQSFVDWAMVPGTRTAVIQVLALNEGSGDHVRTALESAKEAGATSLVLDLRANDGGWGDEAIKVASLFLPAGSPVLIWFDRSGEQIVETVPGDAAPTDLPMVVLVDADTVSAGEILTGALQDAGRAATIGTRTYGTGTGMDAWTLGDGSELWIGTARWLTPNGRSAWHVGLAPDIEVHLPTGVRPISPPALASLGAVGLAASGDAQLLRGLQEVDSP